MKSTIKKVDTVKQPLTFPCLMCCVNGGATALMTSIVNSNLCGVIVEVGDGRFLLGQVITSGSTDYWKLTDAVIELSN